MKNAKKFLLLALSLVMLIGVFAVAAFADDSAAGATVVYPDGTTAVVAVGESLMSEAFKEENGAKLYYGAENTLFKANADWIFTVEGEETALESLTVTEDMVDKKITVTGFEKVYYTNIVAGTDIAVYNTSADTYVADFNALVYTPDAAGSDIKLYADVALPGQMHVRGAHDSINYLDLNGHKLTIPGSGGIAIRAEAPKFYLYSSQPGGVVDASGCTAFLYSNDDGANKYDVDYQKLHPEYDYCDPDKTTAAKDAKHPGNIYFGERIAPSADARGEYGKNITAYCKGLSASLYGGGVVIYGGTFVQVGNNAYFIRLMNRAATVMHADFVLTNASSGVFAATSTSTATRTFTDCNFVYTGEGTIPIFSYTTVETSGSTNADAHFKEAGYGFTRCNFYNVTPECTVTYPYKYNYQVKENGSNVTKATFTGTDTFAVTYPGSVFGFSSLFTMEDLNASPIASAYLAHGATVKEITVNGETYVVDGVLITKPATEALKLTYPKIGTEYFAIGAKLTYEADPAWQEEIDGLIYSDPFFDYSALGALIDADRVVLAGGEAEVPLRYATAPAFSYQIGVGEVITVPTLGSPELDGENFHALLNDKTNVKIVMYSDIVLKKGVLFGTMNDPNSAGKVVGLKASGNVDWDLNGHKVTIDANATAITVMMNSNDSYNNFPALHYIGSTYTLKLYSSVSGGEYVNLSSHSVFGIDKYNATSYLLGTNNKDVCGGDNLTVNTVGALIRGYECDNGNSSPMKAHLYINGGTYIYSGNVALACLGSTNVVKNATIITTGAAKTVFLNHYWKSANLTVDNVTVVAKNDATTLAASGGTTAPGTNGLNATHTITVKNVTLIGKGLNPAYNVNTAGKLNYTVDGNILASDASVLAVAYPTAPEGKTVAYSSITVYGETAKILGYYENAKVVTVQNDITGITETWLVGETYEAGDPSAFAKQKENDVWYYYDNAIWVGAVDGEAVEDILAAANGGKTVIVSIGGDKAPLYYTVTYADGIVDIRYGDAATAKNALENLLNTKVTQGYTLMLYSNMVSSKSSGCFSPNSNSGSNIFNFDLNGYTWTLDIKASESWAMDMNAGKFYFYSSVPNGKLVSTAKSIMRANTHSSTHFGESENSGTEFGKNITFEAPQISAGAFYGDSLYIHGGTYILSSSSPIGFIVDTTNTGLQVMRNATVILKNATNVFKGTNINGTIQDCIFISEKPATLYTYAKGKMSSKTFSGCYFYNITPVVTEGYTMTYKNCYFNTDFDIAQAGGYIAYTGNPVTKTVNGVDYVFGAQLVAEAALVNWGFGLAPENWAIGSYATHENATVDKAFIYAFRPFEVKAENNTIEVALVGVEQGVVQMTLTLQSNILVNIDFGSVLADATVTVDGVAVENLGATFTKAVAPNDANKAITVMITIGENVHKISLGIDKYAKAVLNTPAYAPVYHLTYAMVEYVRSMTSADFGADVEAPEGYNVQTVDTTKVYEKGENELLSSIAFQLGETIAIAIEGAEGKAVHLVLATGRGEWATITNGVAIFKELYVNEFYGDMEIEVYEVNEDETKTFTGETYTYSIENYYNAIDESYKPAAAALYNYAYHADAYVKNLPDYPKN